MAKKYGYTYLEDGGGGLHLIVTENGEAVAGITNLEYAQPGEWNDVKIGLDENALEEVNGWDGHMRDHDIDPTQVWSEMRDYAVVCDNDELFPEVMGRAAEIYFGIERD